MPKWDINNSRYAKFFKSAEAASLRTFIDQSAMLRTNYGFWRTQFVKDGFVTPTAADGTASFQVKMRQVTPSTLMNMRAPLGDSKPVDKAGISFYAGTIVDFIADGIVEKATEREYNAQYYEQFGNDADLIMAWRNEVQRMKDSADATLSNMGAQLISKGQIEVNFGIGAQGGIQKADIPAENFTKAGKTAWTDPNCKILDQMAEIEMFYRDKWGVDMPMKWQIPYKMFMENFLKNNQVIDWIKQVRVSDDKPITDSLVVTEKMFFDAIKEFEGLSPIEIIVEKQRDYTGMVHGWKDGIAVLRPSGPAGVIKYTTLLDQKMDERYGSKLIESSYVPMEGGLYYLVTSTCENGRYKEWHTDLMMSATPTLNEFLYHVIVDTTQANS